MHGTYTDDPREASRHRAGTAPANLFTLGQVLDEFIYPDDWRALLVRLGENVLDQNLSRAVSIGDLATVIGPNRAILLVHLIDDHPEAIGAVLRTVERAIGRSGDETVHACVAAVRAWLRGDGDVDLIGPCRAAHARALGDRFSGRDVLPMAAMLLARAVIALDRDRSTRKMASFLDECLDMARKTVPVVDIPDERARQIADLVHVFPLHALATTTEAA